MGCAAAEVTTSEAECNATCIAAAKPGPGGNACNYQVPKSNISFEMCGTCETINDTAMLLTVTEHGGFQTTRTL